MMTLIDADRQWFKATLGLENIETSLEGSFCRVAIRQDDVLVIPNAMADERFAAFRR